MLAGMSDQASEFLAAHAPSDVRKAIGWLLDNGYTLASHDGGGTFGAQFVYEGQSLVRVTVDRSQWMLDIAAVAGSKLIQYDLAVAAHSGSTYGDRFPGTGRRSLAEPLPDQLPDGVSWRATLPEILEWVRGSDVSQAVDLAQRQRSALMWGRRPTR